MTTPYSYDSYVASTGQTSFVFTFGIFEEDWVHIEINGVEQDDVYRSVDSDTSTLTWSGTTLQGGEDVRVFRRTPPGVFDEVVDWAPGPVSNNDLSTNQRKRRHHVGEIADAVGLTGITPGPSERTMYTLPFDTNEASGYNWTTQSENYFSSGGHLRIHPKESSGNWPWEYNNSDGDITYMDSDGTLKYRYTFRLAPGTYLIKVRVLITNANQSAYGKPEVSVQKSTDDCDTWSYVYAEQADKVDLETVSASRPVGFNLSIVYETENETYDYIGAVFWIGVASLDTYSYVNMGEISITKLD